MLGVPAWLAGAAVLGPKLWLVVCDPLMGSLSDRHKARFGRTPFLAAGAVLTSLGFVLLFWNTQFSSPLVAAAVISLTFLIGSTAFSAYPVPYLAMASELSGNPYERTRILAYRMMFIYAGGILGYGFSQPVIFYFGGHATGWHVMALLYAGICFVTMITPAVGLRGVPLIAGESSSPRGMLEQLATARRNRPFVILTLGSFLMSASQAICYTVLSFMYIYVVQDINFILPFAMSMMVGGLSSQPMWLSLSRRVDKYHCFLIASLGWMLVTLTWLYAKPGGAVIVDLPLLGALTDQKALILVRGVLLGVTNSGFVLMAVSLLTDAIDLQRRVKGSADEGVFSGIYSAVEKLAFAVGPLIAGLGLSLSEFVSSTTGVIPQNQTAVTGIRLLYSVAPAAVQLASVLVFSRYPAAVRAAEAVKPASLSAEANRLAI
jgi:GPH family glycoside/pentoside/hexuronide:cation symporter